MDMAGEVDADFGRCCGFLGKQVPSADRCNHILKSIGYSDSCLERLKTNIESWNEMQNEIRSPILTSTLFTKSLEVLERYGANNQKQPVLSSHYYTDVQTRQGRVPERGQGDSGR